MDHCMRDLDQLQEQDPDQRRRSLATLLVLATVLLGLFGAVFSHWSRATELPRFADDETSGLRALHRLVRLQPTAAAQDDQNARADEQPAPIVPSALSVIDASKLTFERALTGREDRPEVVAALEAAAHAEARGGRKLTETSVMAATRSANDSGAGVSIPASLAATSAGQQLERVARHDKLVAAAMQRPGRGHVRGASSVDGGFLLHVISYESKPAAEALASSLRDKGHEAFVEAGDVDGRGRYFRVRIGPFPSKPAADLYRREFAESERMNTIVVRRDE